MPRRSPDANGKIALPITPMLDMTFQLLFFFIMNFNPADLEGQLEAALPAPDHQESGRKNTAEVPKQVDPVEFARDWTVDVHSRPGGDGSISALSVRGATGKSVPMDDLDDLGRFLAERREASPSPAAVKIRADRQLCVKHLMEVMDVCKAAGFANAALVSPDENPR